MSPRKRSRLTIRDLNEKITIRSYDEFDQWIEIIKARVH